jgi:hypothetical protein
MENFGWNIFEGPDIQGSRRIVKAFELCPGVGGKGAMGSKERRNEASELRCLTVKDIFESLYDMVEKISKAHTIQKLWPTNKPWSRFSKAMNRKDRLF